MVSIAELMPYVKPFLHGMSEPGIERLIIDSAREFSERTGVVIEKIEVNATAGQDLLTPAPADEQEEVVGVLSVDGSTSGFTHYFTSVSLDNQVTEDKAIVVECWTRPKYSVNSINPVLANNYREAIASGAIYRGKMTPGEFLDAPGANTHYQLFEKAVSQAKFDMASSRATKTITKNQPRFI